MTKLFKIGSVATISVLTVAGLIFYFAHLNSQIKTLTEERDGAYWLLVAKEAENDSIKGIGRYSDTVTVWRTKIVAIIDTIPGQVDTLYEDIPVISGSISIDTTKEFGHGSNPLKVRVYGKFYYPEEFSHKNRLLIHPVAGKPPLMPAAKSCSNKSISMMMAFNSNSELMGLAKFRRNRFSIYGGYSIPGKYYLMGMGLRLVEW